MIPISQGPVYEVLVSKLEFEVRLISEFITDLKVHYVAEAVSRTRKPTKDKVNLVSPFLLLSVLQEAIPSACKLCSLQTATSSHPALGVHNQ
jgi:uroporphyrinogen-III decarboxylase